MNVQSLGNESTADDLQFLHDFIITLVVAQFLLGRQCEWMQAGGIDEKFVVDGKFLGQRAGLQQIILNIAEIVSYAGLNLQDRLNELQA